MKDKQTKSTAIGMFPKNSGHSIRISSCFGFRSIHKDLVGGAELMCEAKVIIAIYIYAGPETEQRKKAYCVLRKQQTKV